MTNDNKGGTSDKPDGPQGGPRQNAPQGGPRQNAPQGGPRQNAPQGGPRQNAPQGGPRQNAPQDGPQQNAPQGGPRQNAPQGGPKQNAPQGGPRQNAPQGGPGQQNQPAKPGNAPEPTERALAEPARMKRRHWGVLISFVALVLLPLMVVGAYLWGVADDRYGSITGFTVRQEEGQSSSELISGLAQFAGGATSPDTDVLYEFIRSQNMVRRVDEQLDLRAHYSDYWTTDPVFALWPDATIEDLLWYWGRMVRVSYDSGTGLTQVEVTAYDPLMAQKIAQAIVAESQMLVNDLNQTARNDAIGYAEQDLERAQEQLRNAREALVRFRTRTQIVDLDSDIQTRMGVMNTLQQQLADELVNFDELSATSRSDDPRLTQVLRRIEVIRDRLAEERSSFANTPVLSTGEDYPTLISEFEGLTVEREYAEEVYRAALSTRNAALDNAARQTRYLATYISPTLAEKAQYPQRSLLFGLSVLFLILAWGIIVLVYYSIRDRS